MVKPGDLYVQTLLRASARAGGPEALSRVLGVSQQTLALYLDGLQPVPKSIFLRAIDVLMASDRLASAPSPESQRPSGTR